MTRARDLANIADGTFTATDLNLSGTLDVSGDATFDTNTLFVDVSANAVGIGTTSPSFTAGNKGIHIADATSPAIRLQDTNNSNSDFTIYSPDGDNSLRIYHENNATDFVSITSGGNVGIGTTSPSVKLEVNGGTDNEPIKVVSTDAGSYIAFADNSTTGSTRLGAIADEFKIDVDGSEAMRIDDSGNVGIGTTSPAYKLDVDSPVIQFGNSTDAFAQYKSTAGNWHVGANSSNAFAFYSGTYGSGTERMRITSAGNVGIGTDSPAVSGLEISRATGDATPTPVELRLSTTTSGGGWSTTDPYARISFYSADTSASGPKIMNTIEAITTSATGAVSNLLFKSRTNKLLELNEDTSFFYTGNTERMRIDSSGNLLVGTTSTAIANQSSNTGIFAFGGGAIVVARSGDECAIFNRLSTNGEIVRFQKDGTTVGSISVTASATAYNTSSDYRLKDVDGPITNSGAYIDALKPVQGSWKADGSRFIGLIAHEVQEVSQTPIATGEKDGEEMQGMDYSAPELIANLIAEIQSLRARVAQLEGV